MAHSLTIARMNRYPRWARPPGAGGVGLGNRGDTDLGSTVIVEPIGVTRDRIHRHPSCPSALARGHAGRLGPGSRGGRRHDRRRLGLPLRGALVRDAPSRGSRGSWPGVHRGCSLAATRSRPSTRPGIPRCEPSRLTAAAGTVRSRRRDRRRSVAFLSRGVDSTFRGRRTTAPGRTHRDGSPVYVDGLEPRDMTTRFAAARSPRPARSPNQRSTSRSRCCAATFGS